MKSLYKDGFPKQEKPTLWIQISLDNILDIDLPNYQLHSIYRIANLVELIGLVRVGANPNTLLFLYLF